MKWILPLLKYTPGVHSSTSMLVEAENQGIFRALSLALDSEPSYKIWHMHSMVLVSTSGKNIQINFWSGLIKA